MYKKLSVNTFNSRNEWMISGGFETLEAYAGVYGGYFDMDAEGGKYLILAQNAGSTNGEEITIKGGNSHFSAGIDYTVSIDEGDIAAIQPDSGAVKVVKGTDAYSGAIPQGTDPKGKVFITAGFAAKVAVFKEV